MSNLLMRALAVLAVVAVVGGIIYAMPNTGAGGGGPGLKQKSAGAGGRRGFDPTAPVPVRVATATIADVPVYLDGVGTARAYNTVTVRPQVDGKLTSVTFKEGQDVKRGMVLATIDPTLFQAAVDQALAKKAQDEVLLANQKRDLDRYERVGTLASSQQQIDTQRALVNQQLGLIKADEATIASLSATLGYTKIIAPIDGRTGLRQVDEGNIVHAASDAIVTISQLRPISVLFTLPQQQLGQVNVAFAKGGLSVLALDADNRTVIDKGQLQVVDNQVDASTGTVRFKADFPNADLQLWPGQFANVRLLITTLKDVVTVPTAAVQQGPNGTFAYVVDSESKVSVHPVKLTQQNDVQTVLESGLKAGEQVVISGFSRLKEGSAVLIAPADAESLPAAAGATDGQPGGAIIKGGSDRVKGQGRKKREGGGGGGPAAQIPTIEPAQPAATSKQPALSQSTTPGTGPGQGIAR